MSKKKPAHRVTVKKRNLFGSRLWWATCSCRRWFQGCSEKAEAQRLAAGHEKAVPYQRV